MSAMFWQESPAAMLTRTKPPWRAFSTGAIPASISAIIWGFTPKKIHSQFCAMLWLLPTAQPSSPASASALAKVRLASTTLPGAPLLHAALASAPPMLPQPINPIFSILFAHPFSRSQSVFDTHSPCTRFSTHCSCSETGMVGVSLFSTCSIRRLRTHWFSVSWLL